MRFVCPHCDTSLKGEPEMAGKQVRCPACAGKIQMPNEFEEEEPANQLNVPDGSDEGELAGAGAGLAGAGLPPKREGWVESDHANVNMLMSLVYGLVLFAGLIGLFFALKGTAIGNVFFSGKSGTIVNACELFLFSWSMGILFLKVKKSRHQRDAMILDVLPNEIDREINGQNVSSFIDHVYGLPARLRDSTMVNRIRKSLEFFETRQNNQEVAMFMNSQSDIDASRIQSSYSILKVFLWAVPILGFIGTVLGLSGAIGAIDLSDPEATAASLGNVTAGLGTAFNTTLLGLVLSMIMSFPIAQVQKTEEDGLNIIDAYCNENLLTRLNDGASLGGGSDLGALDGISKAIAGAQKEFLVDLNGLTKQIKENAENLEKRSVQHGEKVEENFTNLVTKLQTEASSSVDESAKTVTKYLTALDTGIRGLNDVLGSLGEKTVHVQQVKKKGWFG